MRRNDEVKKNLNDSASLSRHFFKIQKVYRYRLKKISDMDDEEVNRKCHWFCEENKLIEEWEKFVQENEKYN